MAGANCTIFSFVTPSVNPITRRTSSLLIASSISTPSQSKLVRRKNYLRPKILKTLTKLYPPVTPLLQQESPSEPSIDIVFPQTPQEHDLGFELPTSSATPGEGDSFEQLVVSGNTGTTEEYNGIVGKLSARSVLKYGFVLVGIFVFQTICSVWILGNASSDQKAGDSESGGLVINGRDKGRLLWNGNGKTLQVKVASSNTSNVVYMDDQSELESKIEEIKEMAREARKIEKRKKEENVGDEKGPVSSHRVGIEKEINARLVKLQKRGTSAKEKSPGSHVDSLGSSVNSKDGSGELMFKKKHKYRSPSMKSTKRPKGFQGDARKVSKTEKSGSSNIGMSEENGSVVSNNMQLSDESKQVNQQGIEAQELDSGTSLEDGRNLVNQGSKSLQNSGKKLKEGTRRPNLGVEMRVSNSEANNGVVQKTDLGVSSVQDSQSKKSRESTMQNSQGSKKNSAALSTDGSSNHRVDGNMSVANTKKVKHSNIETDFWWLKLPYVLVIHICRGSDHEGPSGLFTLKATSQEQDGSDSSYTVAFEDRR
ncbi:ABC subfamily C protein [Quillaja saponaria]|uniref:ABC subfamily C protein n=1 Tax=Quillaja saponaria TaxID=32244 RepID=A0AAD7LBJ3_QUISA|nr:ABC subfamily C protein [Quillaja saponaria]